MEEEEIVKKPATQKSPETPSRLFLFRGRAILLGSLISFIILEILFLSPSSVEKADPSIQLKLGKNEILETVRGNQPIIAPGVPVDQIPQYSIRDFRYLSSKGTVRDWKLLAKKANVYQPESMVHGYSVKSYLYDSSGDTTIVTGREAKYFINARGLEIFGDVKAVFSDGFTIYSDYLKYEPTTNSFHIPNGLPVRGAGMSDTSKEMTFSSMGLDFDRKRDVIDLHDLVKFTVIKKDEKNGGLPTTTTIESDAAQIFRGKKQAFFEMSKKRKSSERFVRIRQPDLRVKARTVKLDYGDYSKVLNYMTAYEDVLVQELGDSETPRYSTSGQVDFDTRQNLIILSKFPQVYQGDDTVTGETVRIFRDNDIVEVDRSNAFNEGE